MKTAALVATAALLIGACGSDTAQASPLRSSMVALTKDFVTGLRTNNGQRACARMTPAYRRTVVNTVVKDKQLDSSTGCVALLNRFGAEWYHRLVSDGKPTFKNLTGHGNCASWTNLEGTSSHAVKIDSLWRFGGAGHC
ncbi:MAG: hypothetical protein QOF69_2507 [Solirubrobacteraceae bacterium]|nr:hypothetical protein [Solirubrobacteraceae bacterium]